MKLSDYVAGFLAERGIRHVFAIIGGASLHLIDSLARTPGTTYVCPQHEQAGAMAADAYARVTGGVGAAIATSGPGATNLITGTCCSYFDSVPTMHITGQVTTFRLKRNSGVRQFGFQETDIVDMCRPVTKYAVLVEDARRIRYELEKAYHIATTGRPGPVLLDIPDDLQRQQINVEELSSFVPEDEKPTTAASADDYVERCLQLLSEAERPVVVLGWGVRLAKAEEEAKQFVEALGFPVLPTWAVLDLLPHNNPLVVGTFGTHGTRYGNFTVQNSDLVLSIGARLDTRATGSLPAFAREARKIVVDIDACELGKFPAKGMRVDLPVVSDAKVFLQTMNRHLDRLKPRDISKWQARIADWKARYPICPQHYYEEKDVNPYVFVDRLSEASSEGDTIFIDTGCAIAWTMQGFKTKTAQRLYHDFNNTAMGYALPASIGASFALDRRPVICVVGDGSLQMNIQELATIARHSLPIKIFLINNRGYSMVQQTQEQWLDGRYEATTLEGGLAVPDFVRIAEAYDIPTSTIARNEDIPGTISHVLHVDGPALCNVEVPAQHRVIPQAKYGRAIEDSEPILDRMEFFSNLLVEPHPGSLLSGAA